MLRHPGLAGGRKGSAMKVGDTVKWARPVGDAMASARFVLVEHDGGRGVIRGVGGDPGAAPVRDVPMSDLVLAENAPFVVDPSDD